MKHLATLSCEDVDVGGFSEQRHRIEVTHYSDAPLRQRLAWAFGVVFARKKHLIVSKFEAKKRFALPCNHPSDPYCGRCA